MAKTKEQKKKFLENLEDLLKKTKSLALIDYYGLKVKEINHLRRLLKGANCQYLVTKKTLLKRALDKMAWKIDIDKLSGGIGIIFGLEDEVMPAKLIIQFSKDHGKVKIHGGILNQKFIDETQIKELAQLPTKKQLKMQVVWVIKSPLSGFVNVLRMNLQNLIYVLGEIKKKK